MIEEHQNRQIQWRKYSKNIIKNVIKKMKIFIFWRNEKWNKKSNEEEKSFPLFFYHLQIFPSFFLLNCKFNRHLIPVIISFHLFFNSFSLCFFYSLHAFFSSLDVGISRMWMENGIIYSLGSCGGFCLMVWEWKITSE